MFWCCDLCRVGWKWVDRWRSSCRCLKMGIFNRQAASPHKITAGWVFASGRCFFWELGSAEHLFSSFRERRRTIRAWPCCCDLGGTNARWVCWAIWWVVLDNNFWARRAWTLLCSWVGWVGRWGFWCKRVLLLLQLALALCWSQTPLRIPSICSYSAW